jgi:hypothetical protein
LRGCNVDITDGKDLRYTIEMGSGGMIYILSFIKIFFGHSKVIRADTHSDT